MIAAAEWKWFGHAGHFICARDYHYHLCTQVGKYLVSTVGEHLPGEGVREIFARSRGVVLEGQGDARLRDYMNKIGFEPMGAGEDRYETLVFHASKSCTREGCDCGMPIPTDWGYIDGRRSNSPGEARRIHMEMCEKYAQEGQ